ncbi:SAM-dependent methyltransferase [Gordonia iterans]|uniref:SAM-dependent methyltransferase n=1 Tax=Gordonia iterans TaxID=1004901 RepID=A0A2S0KJ17_9ACTN|nr:MULTISPECIES: class I SAM-dependent methyltransferase [Gordonia]AVM01675.1 SAM-dependent methyltransferase [Gordonia iterans]NLG44963.1 class I SAM-dependent methyltransferase [Gordonia sp. (in: high G+C Gram-positive bacteria)]
MGFYDDKILPRLVEKTCGMPGMEKLRARACAPLSGDIVEIGFGSGLNVACYGDRVTSVTAVEPADLAWARAQERVASSPIPISRGGLDGQSLPFDDDVFDGALSTFTLCTVPELPPVLAELARVVRPGGRLAFLEHGLAPGASVRRIQRLIDPVERLAAGGCELTRDVPAALAAAGWEVAELDQFYTRAAPKPWGWFSLGYAVNSGE